MSVEIVEQSSVSKLITATVEAAVIRRESDKKLQQLAGKVKINGFRPGKAPLQAVRAKHGDEVLRDAINSAVDARFQEIAGSSPELAGAVGFFEMKILDGVDGKSNLSFSFIAEFFPTGLQLPETAGRKVRKLRPTVAAEAIDGELNKLQAANTEIVPVEESAVVESDSIVIVSYRGIGSAIASQIVREEEEIDLGTPNLLPAFLTGLTGMARGETREVSFTLAPDAPIKELAGKELRLAVICNEIKKRFIPAIDDALAAASGEATTLAELRANIEARLLAEGEKRSVEQMRSAIIAELAANVTMELPANHLGRAASQEATNRARQIFGDSDRSQLEKMARNAYPAMHNMVTRVMRENLVINEISLNLGMKITEEDLNAGMEKEASETGRSLAEIKASYASDDRRLLLASQIQRGRIIDLLLETAVIEEVDSLAPAAPAPIADSASGEGA